MGVHAQQSPEVESALARSALYAFLSGVLAYPTAGARARLEHHVVPLVTGVETGDPSFDALLRDLAHDFVLTHVDDLRRAHARVFTHVEPEDYPPYETAYDGTDVFRHTQVMADVAGFYRAHGLRVGGEARERPDHAVTELEFMAFLARKEADALVHLGPDEVAECRRTQVLFLRDHLGCWAPAFGRRLDSFATEPLYRAAGRLLAAWLDAELAEYGVEPERRLDAPQPRLAPDDGGCELADACPVAAGPIDPGREP